MILRVIVDTWALSSNAVCLHAMHLIEIVVAAGGFGEHVADLTVLFRLCGQLTIIVVMIVLCEKIIICLI